jgi:hypothetical protein
MNMNRSNNGSKQQQLHPPLPAPVPESPRGAGSLSVVSSADERQFSTPKTTARAPQPPSSPAASSSTSSPTSSSLLEDHLAECAYDFQPPAGSAFATTALPVREGMGGVFY